MSDKNTKLFSLLRFAVTYFLAYHLSYMVLHLTSLVATALATADLGIPGVLYHSHIEFTEPRDSLLWSFDAVIFIAVVAPALMFIIAWLLLTIMSLKSNHASWGNSLLAWCTVHAFNFSAGALLSDMLMQTGLFFAAEQLRISLSVRISIAIVAAFFLIRVGAISAPRLIAARVSDQNESSNRFPVVLLFITWVTAGVINLFVLGKNLSSLLWITDIMLLIQLLPAQLMIRKTKSADFSTLNNYGLWFLLAGWLVMILVNLFILKQGILFTG